MTKSVSHETRRPMTAVGAELWEMGTQLVRASAHRQRHAHAHWCGCGDYYVCHQEPDQCPVPNEWTCPTCEQEQQDAWVTAMEGSR